MIVDQRVAPGEQVQFNCSVSGSMPVTRRWSRTDGQMLVVDGERVQIVPASTMEALIINNVTEMDSGEYQCITTNTDGTATETATLTVGK